MTYALLDAEINAPRRDRGSTEKDQRVPLRQAEFGEFRLCDGCGEWALWTPKDQRGSVFCCEACARGLGCTCVSIVETLLTKEVAS